MKRAAALFVIVLSVAPVLAMAQTSATTTPAATSTRPYSFPLPQVDPSAISRLREGLELLKLVHENAIARGLLPRNPVPLPGLDTPESLRAALDALRRSLQGATYVQVPVSPGASQGGLLTQAESLLSGSSTPRSITEAIAGSRCVAITGALSVGSTGLEVTTLQQFLATIPALYPEGEVTGYYGALTKRAVERLQGALGVEVTGEVEALTRTVLRTLTCRSR